MLAEAETPELTGHLIWALFNDPALNSSDQAIRPDLAVTLTVGRGDACRPPEKWEFQEHRTQ
ncbi:hypothetical protein [Mycolicibacterium gadium]|uniref:hypothetical protein n=1 Tax=Mycolicibacterium gadium TaxID=1794 RepID=UPI0013D8515B|nr:hypothetical protein [Mycolicibacterium gadium]